MRTTPTVQTMIVVRITMKAISGKTSEPGMPDVRGIEAKSSDLIAAILTTPKRIPRNAKDRNKPRMTDVNDVRLNSRPVKTKKKERIKKLI